MRSLSQWGSKFIFLNILVAVLRRLQLPTQSKIVVSARSILLMLNQCITLVTQKEEAVARLLSMRQPTRQLLFTVKVVELVTVATAPCPS